MFIWVAYIIFKYLKHPSNDPGHPVGGTCTLWVTIYYADVVNIVHIVSYSLIKIKEGAKKIKSIMPAVWT